VLIPKRNQLHFIPLKEKDKMKKRITVEVIRIKNARQCSDAAKCKSSSSQCNRSKSCKS